MTLPSWAKKIEEDVKKKQPESRPRVTIRRVPNNLRQLQDKSFDPKIVTIGPFHYRKRKDNLQAMEKDKIRFLKRLLGKKFEEESGRGEPTVEGVREESGSNQEDKLRLEDLRNAMKEQEDQAKKCYLEEFKSITNETFVKMMIMDGCFIVELLRLYYAYDRQRKGQKKAQGTNGVAKRVVEPLFNTSWMLRTLQHDLLKLENQLPFFVLETLFKKIEEADPLDQYLGSQDPPASLQYLAFYFFNPLLPRPDRAFNSMSETKTGKKYAHLLDFFRSTFIKDEQDGEEPGSGGTQQSNHDGSIRIHVPNEQLIHCASELEELGVEFQVDTKSDLLSLTFQKPTPSIGSFLLKLCRQTCHLISFPIFYKPTLKIPPLHINHNTIPLFLNFVAYEQSDERAKPFFTHYFVFFESLVHSSEDVQLLHKSSILNHALGSNEDVATMLHKFCRELVYDLDHSYLYEEVNRINEYCEPFDNSCLLSCSRDMIHKYFSSPWSCISVFVASVLLVLTIIGTVYTVLSYYQSHK